MALVNLHSSFHDGERLHPGGMYIQIPDEVLVKILQETYEPEGFKGKIKKKISRKKATLK